MSKEVEWITFQLEGERYCHVVENIKEVLNYEEPTPVPSAPSNVTGILNVRGEVVTVLSGRALLGLPPIEPTDQSKIITFKSSGEYYGMIVDSVVEIITFSAADIQPDVSTSAGNNDLVKGTMTYNGELLIVMDLTSYCDDIILTAKA